MKTAIYNKVKRLAVLLFVGGAMTTNTLAQEHLHLFYKDGTHEKIEITEDTKIEFVKRPYLTETSYSAFNNDTIFMPASAGRTFSYGWVQSNYPWTVTADVDWLMTRINEEAIYNSSFTSGFEYENLFMIYAATNETDKERVGHVTIATKQGVTKTFTVVQRPYTLSFYENEYIGNHRYDGEPVDTFVIEGSWDWNNIYYNLLPNFGWEVTSYPEWMRMSELVHGAEYSDFETIQSDKNIFSAGQSTTSYATFTFSPNEDADPRTAYITFEGHGQKAVGIFHQEGLNEQSIINQAEILVKRLYQYDNLGQGRHNDFGLPSLMLTLDSRGRDLVSDYSDYNWFNHALDYSDLTSNYYYTAMYWTTMYNQINAANEVIRAYSDRKEDSKFQFYLAQAYAMRAFTYFYLAQLYQQTYIGNEDAPCVPVIWEGNMDIANTKGCARATVKEVYDFIRQDLDLSLELLQQTEVTRPSKRFVSPEVIYGLRARVNMVRGEWQAAAEDAQRIIESGTATPYTIGEVSKPTFNDINHEAWLWGIDAEEDDRPVTTGLCNWPSHMGSFSYGYASTGVWRKVSKSLYEDIPSTDVRKGWFLDAQATSANLSAEQKEYAASYGMPAYTQVKFAPYKNELGTDINASDIPLMRIEEIYLILAEAQAMMGNTIKAVNTLNTFVTTYRDKAYKCNAITAEDVQDEIWTQRRIELWGEGHSYFDLMRMKKGVDRRGAGFQPNYVYNIPAGDAALIYPIPDVEMNSNPNLIQNPVAEQPLPVADIEDGESVYEKLQGSWVWSSVDANGNAQAWKVNIIGYDEDQEGYNEVLQVTGIMGYSWTSMTLLCRFDETTKTSYVEIPFGYIFAEDVDFGLGGTQDVATGTVADGYISFDGSLIGTWNDDFTEITFEENKIMYGFLIDNGAPNGYTWFNCLNIKLTR